MVITMNELTERSSVEMATLASLAQEARFYSENAARNMLQLGRVLVEAKELVAHGEWSGWVKANADMSQRSAQMLMQAYRRYGGKPAFEKIERAKLFKLMALPEGQEEAFAQDHDLEAMSAREVEEAVKAAKAEAQTEIERERRARIAAEERATEMENRPPEIPDAMIEKVQRLEQEAKEAKEQQQYFAELARKVGDEKAKLNKENLRLQAEITEQNDILQAQQDAYNRAQEELLDLQSAQARGDVERQDADTLTADMFTATVREFIGSCCLLPQMGTTFSTMPRDEIGKYEKALAAVEQWADGVRKAMRYKEAFIVE